MVAKLEGPRFSGGANIAIKCPSHTYEQTVAFYRDTLGLPLIEEEKDGCIFQFGPNRLWIDSVPNLSHPDVWLELETNDTEAAGSFLKVHGITRCDEVARGILTAMDEVKPKVPMVVRLVGTNAEEGRKLLENANMITAETLADAAQKAVNAAKG